MEVEPKKDSAQKSKEVGYQLPWRLVLISAIFGLALDAFDIIGRTQKAFFSNTVSIKDGYLFLNVNDVLDQYGNKDFKSILKQAGEDFNTWTFADVGHLNTKNINALVEKLEEDFCKKYAKPSALQKCIESKPAFNAEIAFYKIENYGKEPTESLEISFDSFGPDVGGALYFPYDLFLNNYMVTNNCLYIDELGDGKRECISNDFNGKKVARLTRGIRAGEIIHLPMYIAARMTYEHINDGGVSSPLRVPNTVKVNGKKIISPPTAMSPTPTILLGTYAERG